MNIIGIDGELPVDDLIDLAELILKKNYFELSLKSTTRNWVRL